MWQDVVLMLGGFGFVVALLPAVRSSKKPPISTSLSTGLILTSFCVVYGSLGLWLAFIATGMTATMWFILAIQVSKRR